MKRLFLIRHAHRDTDQPRLDNGLSEKGHHQSKRLSSYFDHMLEKHEKIRLISSPKKRCIETLEPFSKKRKFEIEIDSRLTEGRLDESSIAFLARIENFLESFKQAPSGIWMVCSHGDWIPTAVMKLIRVQIGLKKAGFVEFHEFAEDLSLHALVQTLKGWPD